jgi:hypothetical protein
MSNGTSRAAGAPMEGGGFYNRHSALQAGGVAGLLPLIAEAARSVPIGSEPVVLADYGSSQGRNAMGPMRVAIEELRRRLGPDRPIQIIHTDLPGNDFAALFTALEDDPASYMSGASRVFPSAVGRSYFEPILPPASVHIGWNTWTLHWLSGDPVRVRDHVLPTLSRDRQLAEHVAERQARDWELFLRCRSEELRPGGSLICGFVGRDGEKTGWEWLGGEFWGAILDLGREGLVSPEEQASMTTPTAGRTVDAVRAPFAETGLYAGLRLDLAELVNVHDPFWPDFAANGDVKAFAESHASTTRGWSGPTMARALGDRSDKAAVLNKLYDRLAERLMVAPQPHETFLAVAVLSKSGDE